MTTEYSMTYLSLSTPSRVNTDCQPPAVSPLLLPVVVYFPFSASQKIGSEIFPAVNFNVNPLISPPLKPSVVARISFVKAL